MNDRANVVGLKSRVWGGNGDDTAQREQLQLVRRGLREAGNNTLFAGGHGGQIADGGSGDDTVNGGGWEGNAAAIGGAGHDFIRFQFGYYGVGDIQGGTGVDSLTSTTNRYAATADGGTGDDIIVIDEARTAARPVTRRPTARFTITAGDGNDSVVAGPKNDTIDAGAGRDFVDVNDGGSDTVSCGDGIDVVRADDARTRLRHRLRGPHRDLEEGLLELTFVLRDGHEGEDVAAARADEHPLGAAAEHDHVAAFCALHPVRFIAVGERVCQHLRVGARVGEDGADARRAAADLPAFAAHLPDGFRT